MPDDPTDARLLALVQADGRMGLRSLGEAVGLSAPAVLQRLRKLEAGGVITGYHARLDPDRVARGIVAFLRVRPAAATEVAALIRRWRQVPAVLECHRLLGGEYLLKLRLGRLEELEAHADAARRAGCRVSAELGLASPIERWLLPVWAAAE